MKKLSLLAQGILYTCVLFAQPSFQTTLEAGISMPLNSNNLNETHTGKAIHFGNHLDYTFGNASVRFGLGAYIGYINAISTDNKYKEIGQAIASKYRFDASQLVYNSSPFKSTDILLGPVVSFGSTKCNINVWAKGGYGLNEPGRYSVVDKENGTNNNIYINQAGENKNGLAYSLGAGIQYAISDYVGLKLSASYFSTQTDQVNYNFDREKGTVPLYATASNQFIQASAGVQFSIGNPDKKKKAVTDFGTVAADTGNPPAAVIKIKTKSNIKNDRLINPGENTPGQGVIKIKTKSNIKNDRLANNSDDPANDNPDNDSLFFSPRKIELRTALPAQEAVSLQSVDNYLTGFLYRRRNGAVIAQCVSSAADSDPIPGVDVHLKRLGSAGNNLMTAKTNKDGSFSFNNIAAGNYIAEAADASMSIAVNGNNESGFKILDINSGSCGDAKENYIINAGDKTYVEITSTQQSGSDMANGKKHVANVKYEDISKTIPRDAATGMASGSRNRKPYLTSNMQFETNMNNIVSCDGKLYAEVITAREAGTGMASGRRTLVTGDIDGDGLTNNTIVSPRDAASGLPTGKRMHKPYIITKELDITENEDDIVSPRDAASGLATGKRIHKPYVITKELDAAEEEDDITSPRDAASGLATGKRMHKPYVITKELDTKRMHKPFVITVEVDPASNEIISPRDAASGLPTGKRMHKPYSIIIDPDEDTYEVISPRDPASGLPTGKRMHKPFVITKELGYNEDGNEIAVYKIIHRDIAARNVLLTDNNDDETEKMAITEQGLPKKKSVKKGIITGKDNDTGMYTDNSGAGEEVVKNPLYEPGGSQGTNPLFEGKDALHITGGSGKGHDIFIPSNIVIVLPVNQPPAEYTGYDVGPVKWMAPESISSRKGIQEKGMKMTPEKMEANSERKGWDGTVKGGSIVQSISRVHCADGSCSIDAIVLVNGIAYEALITGVLATKHDTVKNSISNIR